METKKKSSFTGSIGFILAAAGSAVGVGNIWRFPYLAAKDGGGVFLLVYFVLALTFGFTLLTTDIALGRRTKKNALNAYSYVNKHWKFLGLLTFLVPVLIITYYSVIGGWITKYMVLYLTGTGSEAAEDGYFSSFIASKASPLFFMFVFMAVTAIIVYHGVEKGIEKFSKIIMPGLILIILGISFFSLTLEHTDANGVTRTGLQGFAEYVIPNFEGMTLRRFGEIVMEAMGQLFFSLSVSMGIMITYGSYVKDEVNLGRSVSQIEVFDTGVAFLAGMMIVPSIYVFSGTEGMKSGPSLMFVSLPKVFDSMGTVGNVIGAVFFIMVVFAALTSCVSIMEAIVANCMELFHKERRQMSIWVGTFSIAGAVLICLGYNVLYFDVKLPNGASAQLLDVVDYISNSFLMPIVSFGTCIFAGWITKPKWIIEEVEKGGHRFGRKRLYAVMIRYVAPALLLVLFLQSLGVL